MGTPPDNFHSLEKELANLKSELEVSAYLMRHVKIWFYSIVFSLMTIFAVERVKIEASRAAKIGRRANSSFFSYV